jgi:CDP-paratose 2-epimerase
VTLKRVLVTGSSGLIGSEAVTYFDQLGWTVVGVDNNMRRDFFGPDGDTTWNLERLRKSTTRFDHHHLDVRDRTAIDDLVKRSHPDLIVHCAAQPSHDLAKDRPFDDFEVNAVGTLNLLEAARQHCLETPFVYLSTNKVYGDAPNEIPLVELETRFDYANAADAAGVSESCRVDASTHSLFGASKLAADIMVQEYGRYFGMPTVCLRGGCLTGARHSAAELHGFLAYVAKALKEGRTYRIYGYRGKQVRDNIHALDVCRFFGAFHRAPRVAAVYNIGGGRENSISVIEAIARLEALTGTRMAVEYVDVNRIGDHICYISDLSRLRHDYPDWDVTVSVDEILRSMVLEDAPIER